jgi:hypothetical protein
MVYFEDTGTVIEAPIDSVWEYLVSEHHAPAHSKSTRNFQVKETIGSTAVVSAERFLNGTWSGFVSRSTDFPPLCICNEEVEGDFAGTRFVVLYRPHGTRTQVEVYGDVQSRVFAPEEARRTFLQLLESAYLDDSAAMREIHKNRHR